MIVLFGFRSSPTEQLKFTFDSSLVEDTSGKLQPDQLTVDNLTIDSVQSKMADLESRLKDIKERRSLTNQDTRYLYAVVYRDLYS